MIIDYDPYLGKFVADAPFEEIELLRRIPNRKFDKTRKVWLAGPTKSNVEYFRRFRSGCTCAATAKFEEIDRGPSFRHGVLPDGFAFEKQPMSQQLEPLLRMVDLSAYALFMDPGTGKTKVWIDDAAISYLRKETNAAVVLCPNSVKSNWAEQIEEHSPIGADIHVYEASRKEKASQFTISSSPNLKWFIMGVESLSQGSADAILDKFLCLHRCTFIIDESDTIATHDSIRTKKVLKYARLAPRRRLGTGTPISKGIHNTWAQYEFLDPGILDCGYYAFTNHYCIKGGFKGKQIVANCNEQEFIDLVAPFTFQISKKDCLDLPPKVYQTRTVEPTAEQKRIYEELRITGAAKEQGTENILLSYTNTLVRDLRLQQVCGGFVTPDPPIIEGALLEDVVEERLASVRPLPISGGNPKLADLLAYVHQIPDSEKAIIWVRFKPELALIAESLRKAYGDEAVVEFHGDVKENERTIARQRFQTDPDCRFFVGQISTGGVGITLTAASYELYFSNSWALRDRIQSEDRAHRIGQSHESVTIVDFMMQGSWVDSKIHGALKQGKSYTELVMQELHEATRGQGICSPRE